MGVHFVMFNTRTKNILKHAITQLLSLREISDCVSEEHTKDTPRRFVEAFQEYFSGCYENPVEVLERGFSEQDYDQMVFVNDISFVSHCAHHLAPFIGKVHFAYLPKGRVVGLSKIARAVDILARRPQIQEKLSQEIVNTFQGTVQPVGCGVVIEAIHFCMCARGVKKPGAYTRTVALKGEFIHTSLKNEFLAGAVSKRNELL